MMYVALWSGLTMFVGGVTVLAHTNNNRVSMVSTFTLVMGGLIAFAAALTMVGPQ